MKTILFLCLSAILSHATFGADDSTPLILQPGKDYALAFAESARMSVNGPVRVLAVLNGWVRIEYTPRQGVGVAREKPSTKQVWLNLAHVVTIQDWKATVQDA